MNASITRPNSPVSSQSRALAGWLSALALVLFSAPASAESATAPTASALAAHDAIQKKLQAMTPLQRAALKEKVATRYEALTPEQKQALKNHKPASAP
jgi:hypothetical protein